MELEALLKQIQFEKYTQPNGCSSIEVRQLEAPKTFYYQCVGYPRITSPELLDHAKLVGYYTEVNINPLGINVFTSNSVFEKHARSDSFEYTEKLSPVFRASVSEALNACPKEHQKLGSLIASKLSNFNTKLPTNPQSGVKPLYPPFHYTEFPNAFIVMIDNFNGFDERNAIDLDTIRSIHEIEGVKSVDIVDSGDFIYMEVSKMYN